MTGPIFSVERNGSNHAAGIPIEKMFEIAARLEGLTIVGANLTELLRTRPAANGSFTGPVRKTTLERTFGGQLVAQALSSAASTVNSALQVHSLHGYFLRPGDPLAPTEFLVEPGRDGRSFAHRRVLGRQEGVEIFSMAASFHLGSAGLAHQSNPPAVGRPEDARDIRESPDGATAHLLGDEWSSWDIRRAEPLLTDDWPGAATTLRYWIRHSSQLAPDPLLHACVMGYASDMVLLTSASLEHPGVNADLRSLDHSVWFLRPFSMDNWILIEASSPSAEAGRALTYSRMFDQAGRMVAAAVQEGLAIPSRTVEKPASGIASTLQ